MKIFLIIIPLTLFLSTIYAQNSFYLPERNKDWIEKDPSEYKINVKELNDAISFAEANEYSGSRDLRIAILKGFEREPFHDVLGPTKKRVL